MVMWTKRKDRIDEETGRIVRTDLLLSSSLPRKTPLFITIIVVTPPLTYSLTYPFYIFRNSHDHRKNLITHTTTGKKKE